jgi:hypothetical protein
MGSLEIGYNPALTSLSGLDNIDPGSFYNLWIGNNSLLSTCDVQSICDLLANPIGGIYIGNNAPGCNSQQEVENACAAIGVQDLTPESILSVYPNPTSTTITVEVFAHGSISILNISGQKILHREISKPTTTIDVSGLKNGIYFVQVTCERAVLLGKFIKQ